MHTLIELGSWEGENVMLNAGADLRQFLGTKNEPSKDNASLKLPGTGVPLPFLSFFLIPLPPSPSFASSFFTFTLITLCGSQDQTQRAKGSSAVPSEGLVR